MWHRPFHCTDDSHDDARADSRYNYSRGNAGQGAEQQPFQDQLQFGRSGGAKLSFPCVSPVAAVEHIGEGGRNFRYDIAAKQPYRNFCFLTFFEQVVAVCAA